MIHWFGYPARKDFKPSSVATPPWFQKNEVPHFPAERGITVAARYREERHAEAEDMTGKSAWRSTMTPRLTGTVIHHRNHGPRPRFMYTMSRTSLVGNAETGERIKKNT
jgi:hypothetical protein